MYWIGLIALASCIRIDASTSNRMAIVITIAGKLKLSDYFDWGCRTIQYAEDMYDMIIFHEGNEKLLNQKCASNVKKIDLGENGIAHSVVKTITRNINISSENLENLVKLTSDVIHHIPRYLVEIKPMTGEMFENYLSEYSHWTYSDPDIIWGNISAWLRPEDYSNDILTLAKPLDAGRLFLRGQFALHRNVPKINRLWRNLKYLSPKEFAHRIGSAHKELQKSNQGSVLQYLSTRFIYSAEGWYSQVVFRDTNLRVKIASRGFDDFHQNPIVLHNGNLIRCPSSKSPKACILAELAQPSNLSISDFLNTPMVPAESKYDEMVCRMFWLPIELRFCLVTSNFDKSSSNTGNHHQITIDRPLDSSWEYGKWWKSDHQLMERYLWNVAAFFHFRHWDDMLSKRIETNWNDGALASSSSVLSTCMMIRIKSSSNALAFEDCETVLREQDTSTGEGEEKRPSRLEGRSRRKKTRKNKMKLKTQY